MPHTAAPAARRAAFTLVELLVVVAIVFLLLTLVGMGTSSMVQASRLSEAVVQVESALRLASQRASIENREIEVRFYEIPTGPGAPDAFAAFQVMRYDIPTDPAVSGYQSPGGAGFHPQPEPVSELQRLPSGIAFHAGGSYSTLLTDPARTPTPATATLDGAARAVRRIRFLPRGGTDLTGAGPWTLTLCEARHLEEPALPANHAVVVLDAETARVSLFRPR